MSEHIKKIHSDSEELVNKIESINELLEIRAVIFIFENPLLVDEAQVCAAVKSIKIPTILALKVSASAEIVEAFHLCIASENIKISEFSADEALKKGLINKVVSSAEVEEEAEILAEKISTLAPIAIQSSLKAVNKGLEMLLDEGLKLETELFTKIFSTEDMREGTQAFLEKRQPIFKGK